MTPSAEPTSNAEAAPYLVPANLLGDNEIIVLAIKPSGWFVLTASVPILAAAVVAAAAAIVIDLYHDFAPAQAVISFCAAVAFARAVLACWQWVGRTYVLTNLRMVCVRGLINVDVKAVGLTDVHEVVLSPSVPERLVGIGSIYCLSAAGASPGLAWSAVARPREVHEIVDQAIRRARGRKT